MTGRYENGSTSRERQAIARALDQVNIEVTLPRQYREDPVDFVAQVMSIQMIEPQTRGRVIINERAGSIVLAVKLKSVRLPSPTITWSSKHRVCQRRQPICGYGNDPQTNSQAQEPGRSAQCPESPCSGSNHDHQGDRTRRQTPRHVGG